MSKQTNANETNVLELGKVLVDWHSILICSKPKPHPSGSKVINVNLKGSRSYVRFANPLMLTWGAQENKDDKGQLTGKFSLSLQFPSADFDNPECQMFFTNIKNLETCLKQFALDNSLEWFGKKFTSIDMMDVIFNDVFHYPKKEKGSQLPDLERAPTITIKLPYYSNKWKSEIYDEDCNPLFVHGKYGGDSPIEFLPKRTLMMGVTEIGGIWIANGKASITFNLYQAIVQCPKQEEPGVCILRPKTEDVQMMKSYQPEPLPLEDENVAIVEDDHELYSSAFKQPEESHSEPPPTEVKTEAQSEEHVTQSEPEPAATTVKKTAAKVVRRKAA